MLSSFLVLFFILCANALRFCAWQDHHTVQSPHAQQNMNKILMEKDKVKQKRKITQQFQQLLYKNEQLRSYHPHYLHSYSYPQPITPHIYFGQLNNQGSYVFLLKNNETLRDNEQAGEIFFVNGQQQYGTKNLLQRFSLRTDSKILNFAMVIQIQNMLQIPIQTKMSVFNFGSYLGVVCQIYEDYYKSFIVYLSQKGKKAVSLSQISNSYTITFKNLQSTDSRNNWRNSEEEYKIKGLPNITFQKSSQIAHNFSSLVMIINYNSEQSARDYKIAVQQFPIKEFEEEEQVKQFTSLKEIREQMAKVKIDSLQYKFRIPSEKSEQSCQNKAINQLLQGLSYQYGTLSLKNGTHRLPNKPKELYSFTPSRKRFPWGFLWDDGFHCQVAIRSQPQITLKVLKSWLDTMFDFGWIPREQNRGPQRQFLCSCPNFMTKDVRDGNPPTLLLSLGYLARQRVLSRNNFEEKYWKKLNSWFKWFSETQTAEQGSYIFRWYDSIVAEGSFNSGMDDFPRLPNSIGHVDCQAWMYFFSQTLSQISQALDYEDIFYNESIKIRQKFVSNFIEQSSKIPNDFTISNGKKIYNSHFGYPSILPLAFGMIDQTTQAYTRTMTKIRNELDLGFGLTSMSTRDSYYLATNDAYWRGPVWVNINYLFLRGLNLFYPQQKQYYQKLRLDLIKTVCGQEQERGYFFENYIKGRGSFSYPFTGWTSLISIIVRQNY